MKKMTFFVLLALTSSAFAGPEPIKHDSGYLQVATPEQMPLPLPASELKKIQESNSTTTGKFSAENSPEKVKNFLIHYNAVKNAAEVRNSAAFKSNDNAPEVHSDLKNLKVGFKFSDFKNAQLRYALPIGTQVNNSWTGLERFYEIDGVGLVRLTEYELSLTNGKFYMLKSSVNSDVRGNQAITKSFADETGQTLEEVVWMDGSRFYTLSFLPQVKANKDGRKQKITADTHAVSLAHELN